MTLEYWAILANLAGWVFWMIIALSNQREAKKWKYLYFELKGGKVKR